MESRADLSGEVEVGKMDESDSGAQGDAEVKRLGRV